MGIKLSYILGYSVLYTARDICTGLGGLKWDLASSCLDLLHF